MKELSLGLLNYKEILIREIKKDMQTVEERLQKHIIIIIIFPLKETIIIGMIYVILI